MQFLLRFRGSPNRDPILKFSPSGGPEALTKTKTKLMSHVAGARGPASVRFCFWCLGGEREAQVCSAQFPHEIPNTKQRTRSQVNGHYQPYNISGKQLFSKHIGEPCVMSRKQEGAGSREEASLKPPEALPLGKGFLINMLSS